MRNHYIQKRFIENFCGDNGILIYDIINDKFLPKHKKANNIALENDLYHFEYFDYPDEQIEKDFKVIEDKSIDIINKISETEVLPTYEDKSQLIAYFYYQSLRTPSQMTEFNEEIRKLDKICKTTVFNDLPIFRIYNEESNIKFINQLLSNYEIYLLKQKEPIFFFTDCFCRSLQSGLEQVIPITSYLAIYLVPKNRKRIFNLTLKKNIANLISFEEYLVLITYSVFDYQQFAYASYADINLKLLPAVFKLLHK